MAFNFCAYIFYSLTSLFVLVVRIVVLVFVLFSDGVFQISSEAEVVPLSVSSSSFPQFSLEELKEKLLVEGVTAGIIELLEEHELPIVSLV